MKYTDRIMTIVNGAMSQREQIVNQMADLDAQLKAERITAAVHRENKASLEKQLEAIRMDAAQKLQETGKVYREFVEQGNQIDSSMLHDDAKLLQMDVDFTQHQFDTLVEKHKDNPLMLQLLQEYSTKRDGKYGLVPSGASKMDAFDRYVGAALDAIRTPDSLKTAFFEEGKCSPQICTESE